MDRLEEMRTFVKTVESGSITAAAEDGHGIVLEPSFILHQSIEGGRLRPILRDHQWPTLHAYAVYPRTRHLSRRVRAFVDFLVERFAGVPYWDRCLESGEGPPS